MERAGGMVAPCVIDGIGTGDQESAMPTDQVAILARQRLKAVTVLAIGFQRHFPILRHYRHHARLIAKIRLS